MAQHKQTSFRAYYGQLLWRAAALSFHVSDAISTIVGALLPPLARVYGTEEKTVTALAWEIPLCAFGAMMICRLIAAPFLLHRENEQRASRLLRKAARKRAAIQAELSTLRGQLDDKQRIEVAKLVIANLMKLGDELSRSVPDANDSSGIQAWTNRYAEWNSQCYHQIKNSLGDAEATSVALHKKPLMPFSNEPASAVLNYIFWRMEAMRELVAKLN